jgi:DEAD_2.
MDKFADYFPYPQYRPHQKQMLDFAYNVAKNGGIGLINAPTGSGKTSVISAVLASVKDDPRTIIIASRMVSQIEVYTNELHRIRATNMPNLKYGYIIGKNKSCNRFDDQDQSLLNQCRKLSKNYKKNTLNPKNTESKLEECTWYANSVIYNIMSKKFEPSLKLTQKINQFVTTTIDQSGIKVFSEPCCPYEIMKYASNYCDVIICNYHHLLNPIFRNALFANYFSSTRMGNVSESQKPPIVIFDEAHNLPQEISNLFSTSINKASIDELSKSLVGSADSTINEYTVSESETEFASQIRIFLDDPIVKPILQTEGFTVISMVLFLRQMLTATLKFIGRYDDERKKEIIIDPDIFLQIICSETNENNLLVIAKKIRLLYTLIETFEPQADDETSNVEEDNLKSLTVLLKFLSI